MKKIKDEFKIYKNLRLKNKINKLNNNKLVLIS